MTALYPSFDMPTSVTRRAQQSPLIYRKSFLWDFIAQDFVLDAAGRPVVCDGWTAWAQWCIKAVLTERFAYLIYPRSYGVELEDIPQIRTRAEAEARVAHTITDALKCDRRTSSVGNFLYTWNGDSAVVSFRVVPTIGSPLDVELTIG